MSVGMATSKRKKSFSVLTVYLKYLTVLLALSLVQVACAQNPEGKPVPGGTLSEKLEWLKTNVKSDTSYILTVKADESIAPKNLSYDDKNGITIHLIGSGKERIVSLSSKGSLFTVESGVTLVLNKNITLQGRNDNSSPLITVYPDGTFIMNNGSALTGNAGDDFGGGVAIFNGTFTMNDGTISGNTADTGGGVAIANGTFTMNDGTISGNTGGQPGGGVLIANGSFTMNGGTVSGNTAQMGGGGVVIVVNGSFSKTGGTITGYGSDPVNGNVVKDGSGAVQSNEGHAVYAVYNEKGTTIKRKETTAGPEDNLSFNSDTATGAWDDVPTNDAAQNEQIQMSGNQDFGIALKTYSEITPRTTDGLRSHITFSAGNQIEMWDDKYGTDKTNIKTGKFSVYNENGIDFLSVSWTTGTTEKFLFLTNNDIGDLYLYKSDSSPAFLVKDDSRFYRGTGTMGVAVGGSDSWIKASSSLREGSITFSPDKLGLTIGECWATSRGINERLTLSPGSSLTMASEHIFSGNIYISSGVVSFSKSHLYSENSRIRKIRLYDDSGNSRIIELKDTPHFQPVSIKGIGTSSGNASILHIEIIEVYPGSKYPDTCLNSICGVSLVGQ